MTQKRFLIWRLYLLSMPSKTSFTLFYHLSTSTIFLNQDWPWPSLCWLWKGNWSLTAKCNSWEKQHFCKAFQTAGKLSAKRFCNLTHFLWVLIGDMAQIWHKSVFLLSLKQHSFPQTFKSLIQSHKVLFFKNKNKNIAFVDTPPLLAVRVNTGGIKIQPLKWILAYCRHRWNDRMIYCNQKMAFLSQSCTLSLCVYKHTVPVINIQCWQKAKHLK